MTFSHPDYTVGFRFTLNRRQPPAPVARTGRRGLGTWSGNQLAFAGLAAPAASPPVGKCGFRRSPCPEGTIL